tara:strand:+ start:1094 stop:1339 length:246 start_codon:yes stop_codon:yes gene_type:complete
MKKLLLIALLIMGCEDNDNLTSQSTEIDYISKDGLSFGVYEKKGKLKYAIHVSRTADWAFLKEIGVEQLKQNIQTILNLKK